MIRVTILHSSSKLNVDNILEKRCCNLRWMLGSDWKVWDLCLTLEGCDFSVGIQGPSSPTRMNSLWCGSPNVLINWYKSFLPCLSAANEGHWWWHWPCSVHSGLVLGVRTTAQPVHVCAGAADERGGMLLIVSHWKYGNLVWGLRLWALQLHRLAYQWLFFMKESFPPFLILIYLVVLRGGF